jgi:hypothetical protein
MLTQYVHIKRLVVLHDSMAGIVPTLRSAAQLYVFTQDIYDLPLAFVTPLRTENNCRHLLDSLCEVVLAYE